MNRASTTEIYLVRHGETDWNIVRRWQGHAVTPLNAKGFQQASKVAARLAKAKLDALYSSDSVRARQTAEIIANITGLDLVLDEQLREIDLGEWQGFTRDEILAVDGERYTARGEDIMNIPVPGGEAYIDVATRMREAVEALAAKHDGERVALVSHGGAIKSLLYTLNDDQTAREALSPHIGNTAITILAKMAEGWQVRLFNDTSHLA